MTWQTWVTVIEFPILFALAGLVWRTRVACDAQIEKLREQYNNFRVEVAKEYVTNKYLQEVEGRLIKRLEAIDKKLDRNYEGRGHD